MVCFGQSVRSGVRDMGQSDSDRRYSIRMAESDRISSTCAKICPGRLWIPYKNGALVSKHPFHLHIFSRE